MSKPDPSHPHAGNPRTFLAAAMPNGDARFGIEGELVFLCEQRGGCVDRLKYLSRAEAEQLRDALHDALRSLGRAAAMSPDPRIGSGVLEAEMAEPSTAAPRAYRGPYPIRDGGTLADLGFCDEVEAASRSAATGTRGAV